MRTIFPILALVVIATLSQPSRVTVDAATSTIEEQPAASLNAAFPALDRAVREFTHRENIPGAAWGVMVDGKLVHVGTTGLRELFTKSPVTADTVFRIASMTKSFTAMAVMKLREQGKLSLDDPAERYVPELKGLKYPTSDSPRITVRHLLSHAEGFPEDNPWGDQQLAATEEEFSAMMRRGIPFSNAPGLAYEYSNYGFAILGRIVQNVSKMPYRQYIATEILKPLGMTATTLEPTAVPADRLAHGYRWEDEQWKEEPQLPDGAFGAMGGMLTSLNDLARYVSVYLGAWPPRDGPETAPISRASLREMQQVWRSRPAVVTRSSSGVVQLNAGGYGYGLGITQTCDFGHVVAHSGGLPGFGSQMRWLPEYGVALIAMGNRTYTGWGSVFNQAVDLLHKTGALRRRMPEPSAALVKAREEVTELVMKWDSARAARIAAVNLFRDRSEDRRRREIEALRAKVGACKPTDQFTFVENALRGTWTLSCERGNLGVAITLAPTIPPTVQYLEVSPSQPQPAMTADAFRRIALGLTGASEGAHMGHPDFRAHGRIFATLQTADHGMVKLTPEQQDRFVREHPAMFASERGAWGAQGCTRVHLTHADPEIVGEAVTLAWQNAALAAPKRRAGRRQIR
jgi:CubicO group peptidase (beta-lactamase class C family)